MPRYIVTFVIALSIAGSARAQAPASAQLATALVQQLEDASMQAIAAADPEEAGRFIAALYIPGGDLLVVSAKQPSADAVARRIENRMFRDVYVDLQATPTPQGKFFVQDAHADGLFDDERSGASDILYEDGTKTTVFNGDSKAQQLSDAEYDARFKSADARYAQALMVLKAALEAPSASSASR